MPINNAPRPRVARKKPWTRRLVAFIVVAGLAFAYGLFQYASYWFEGPDGVGYAARVRIVEPAEGARLPAGRMFPVAFHIDHGRRVAPWSFNVTLTSADGRDGGNYSHQVQDGDRDPGSPWRASLGSRDLKPGVYRVEVNLVLRDGASLPHRFGFGPRLIPAPAAAAVTVEVVDDPTAP